MATHLEIDRTAVAIHRLQQRRSETQMHGKRCHVWFNMAQLAHGPDRQRLEGGVTAVAREGKYSLVATGGRASRRLVRRTSRRLQER